MEKVSLALEESSTVKCRCPDCGHLLFKITRGSMTLGPSSTGQHIQVEMLCKRCKRVIFIYVSHRAN